MIRTLFALYCALLCAVVVRVNSTWISKEVAQLTIDEFEKEEKKRNEIQFRGTDRRPSTPFITGNGFRSICAEACENDNRCRVNMENLKYGDCIFIKTDLFEMFVKNLMPNLPKGYVLVSHNGDLSAPDGQNDAPRIGMPKYVVSDILEKEYAKGHLIAHYGQNLWWINNSFTPRPKWSHCLPIGFENREYNIGKQVHVYAQALKRYILDRPTLSIEEQSKKPLLLIAFYPKSRVPDRTKVLQTIGVIQPKGSPPVQNPWYNNTDLNHIEWLEGAVTHRFVLAPFGHGLDTHRISEILLMGGIPVMRRSTISSCYDDSDNVGGRSGQLTRGSLPVVILDKWEDLTKERLEKEWKRISAFPSSHWDWKRLFFDHWADRILK